MDIKFLTFICIGENGELKYGKQRVWGTIGFGITAFVAGYIVDLLSFGEMKNYTPVFVIVSIFTILDVISCINLTVRWFFRTNVCIEGSRSVSLDDVDKVLQKEEEGKRETVLRNCPELRQAKNSLVDSIGKDPSSGFK